MADSDIFMAKCDLTRFGEYPFDKSLSPMGRRNFIDIIENESGPVLISGKNKPYI
jgi:hypothetical protein